jgi:hypothetical protein
MTHYKILKNDYLDKLQDDVNEHLQRGYQLAGGVSADKVNNYMQAVFYIDDKKIGKKGVIQ